MPQDWQHSFQSFAIDPEGRSPDIDRGDNVATSVVLAQAGEYDSAVRGLKAVLDIDPQSALALRILGLVFHLMGRNVAAVGALNQAIDPRDSSAYYYRCLALGPNDPANAVRDCEAAIGIQPNLVEAHLGLANALLALGQNSQADAEAREMVTLAPRSPLGFVMRGKIAVMEGDSTAAQADNQMAIHLTSDHGRDVRASQRY